LVYPNSITKLSIKENGLRIKNKDLVYPNSITKLSIKENGLRIKNKDKALFIGKMAQLILELSSILNLTVTVFICSQTVLYIKEIGKTIK
jgi:hypothetical protein